MTRERRNPPSLRFDMTHGARVASVLLLLLVLAMGGANLLATYEQVHSAQRAEARTTATVTQLCQAGNEFRAEQVHLWGFVVSLSKAHPPPNETAAQRRQQAQNLTAFEAYLHKVFRPKNCAAFVRHEPH